MTLHPPRPNEVEYHQRMRAIAERMPQDVLADLLAEHQRWGWECAAASEGQACCMDFLRADLDLTRSM